MTGFNHATTGMLIGVSVAMPLAIPIAIASHFILDTLPHYGIPQAQRDTSKLWRPFFTIDFFFSWGIGFYALLSGHPEMFWVGLVACLPDFFWVRRVIVTRSFDMSQNETWFTRWHAGIQHFERPWGIWIEIPLSIILATAVFWVVA